MEAEPWQRRRLMFQEALGLSDEGPLREGELNKKYQNIWRTANLLCGSCAKWTLAQSAERIVIAGAS